MGKVILVKTAGQFPRLYVATALQLDEKSGYVAIDETIAIDDEAVATNLVPRECCVELDMDLLTHVNAMSMAAENQLKAVHKLLEHGTTAVDFEFDDQPEEEDEPAEVNG